MNDFERAQQSERGSNLLEKATKHCNNGNYTKGFAKSSEALEIFLSIKEEDKKIIACNLLKQIDKHGDFDVKEQLKSKDINYERVCPLTKAEIDAEFLR